jgi:hypothetical protein
VRTVVARGARQLRLRTFGLGVLSGVAGCFLHPYQRWECGCSVEQRIRIIIMLQLWQQAWGLNVSVAIIVYTCDAILNFSKRNDCFVSLSGCGDNRRMLCLHAHTTHSHASMHSMERRYVLIGCHCMVQICGGLFHICKLFF